MRKAIFAVSMLCATLTIGFARADAVSDFYKGKQIRLIVGSGNGGGYDLYARTLARSMSRYIPGNPTIVVQNQPGAGGITVTNQVYQIGPKDGTVIIAPLSGIPTAPLFQPEATFDPTKLIWLGSITDEAYVAYAWHTVAVNNIRDVATTELSVGGTSAGSSTVDYPQFMNELLGYKFKIIRGYAGPPEINLATERGEVEGNGSVGWALTKSLEPEWIRDKKIKVLLQFNQRAQPDLKDVPLVFDLAKTQEQRQAMRLMFSRADYGRPFFLPPDVPADRVAALRLAFDETMKDKDFLADAAQQQFEVRPMSGADLQKLIGELIATPPDVVAKVRAILAGPAAH
jgi:tripartite-type tricarboxylate transporter receptor subunit TctC